MTENFRFAKLSKTHKKRYIIYMAALYVSILLMALIAIDKTNPVIVETSDKMSFSIGAMIGIFVMFMAFFNRLKYILKIKFVVFFLVWAILYSMNSVMDTLIWTVGLVMIPLMIDDLILLPLWRNLWYNVYE